MTKKKNSVEVKCQKCGETRRIGFNRINKKKFTSCKCGERITVPEEVMSVLERDNIQAKRKRIFG